MVRVHELLPYPKPYNPCIRAVPRRAMPRPGVAYRGMLCRGVAWRGVAWRGVAWRGVAWRAVPWRGVAWHGVAWRGMACRAVPCHAYVRACALMYACERACIYACRTGGMCSCVSIHPRIRVRLRLHTAYLMCETKHAPSADDMM